MGPCPHWRTSRQITGVSEGRPSGAERHFLQRVEHVYVREEPHVSHGFGNAEAFGDDGLGDRFRDFGSIFVIMVMDSSLSESTSICSNSKRRVPRG